MTENFEDRARAEAKRQVLPSGRMGFVSSFVAGAEWAREQEMTEAEIAAVADALDPHWRTDCSDCPVGGPYVRWVRCRCGWESPKSEAKVNIPDMHHIWNGHVAHVLLTAKEAE